MPTYVIERDIEGAGALSQQQLAEISKTSCDVLADMEDVRWDHSYVTGDRIYCVYDAPTEDRVREHAERGGFPANRVSEVKNVIDPSTAG